jgi:CPA1 family monovalent cation:H+ antiporter
MQFPPMSLFDVSALLLTLSALFGWINRRFLHLPRSIGLLLMGLIVSALLATTGALLPDAPGYVSLRDALQQIDFTGVVMNGMLAFLLFAGALNVRVPLLWERAGPVASLAFIATLISTAIVGVAFFAVAQLWHYQLPLAWSLVFGALISPTDPVAVLSTLERVHLPKPLRVEIEGEALLNDGVGVVLFTFLLALASGERGQLDVGHALLDLLREAGGGLVLGCVTGYIAYRAIRTIDDFAVEVLITLALVMATYTLAARLGTSGPLAVVAAGLLFGERAPRDAMSERTEGYVTALWTLIDEVLNSVLFLLIGLEIVLLPFVPGAIWLGVCAIPIVLIARFIAVWPPLLWPAWRDKLSVRNVPFLTWAGVRGGISVALALSLPDTPHKATILMATYAVVLFSILAQGSTLPIVARMTVQRTTAPD